MLRTRLALLQTYVQRQNEAAQRGDDAALDLVALRRINALCHALPALTGDRFNTELAASFNDGALLAYLASLTRMLDTTNSVVDRANALSDAKPRGMMGMHAFFQ